MEIASASLNDLMSRVGSLVFHWSWLEQELTDALRRHGRVMAELHGIGALPAGDGPQPRLVVGHFRERHHAADRHEVAAGGLGTRHLPALARKIRGVEPGYC